jgi:hypothetical protein
MMGYFRQSRLLLVVGWGYGTFGDGAREGAKDTGGDERVEGRGLGGPDYCAEEEENCDEESGTFSEIECCGDPEEVLYQSLDSKENRKRIEVKLGKRIGDSIRGKENREGRLGKT